MTADRFALARAGFSRGDRYERARPGYPADAVDELCAELRIGPGTRVLDLAAGTGKLTRDLAARGARIVAVEPVDGMRAQIEELPWVEVMSGTADAIPLPDGSVDAVTVGQAFHWFDGPRALREIHRVLVRGGALGVLWNVMDRAVPWVDRLQERIHRHRGRSPWYAGHEWRAAFTGECFGELGHKAFPNRQILNIEGLVERVATISFISLLDPRARNALMTDVAGLIREEGVAGADGTFALPYVTDVFWCRRHDG